MDDGPPSLHDTSIQEPGISGRTPRPEAPVDTMLKDMATIIFSTFLLAGWVAFVITYPKVSRSTPPSGLLSYCNYPVMAENLSYAETRLQAISKFWMDQTTYQQLHNHSFIYTQLIFF